MFNFSKAQTFHDYLSEQKDNLFSQMSATQTGEVMNALDESWERIDLAQSELTMLTFHAQAAGEDDEGVRTVWNRLLSEYPNAIVS